jgi:hypothetical protein
MRLLINQVNLEVLVDDVSLAFRGGGNLVEVSLGNQFVQGRGA